MQRRLRFLTLRKLCAFLFSTYYINKGCPAGNLCLCNMCIRENLPCDIVRNRVEITFGLPLHFAITYGANPGGLVFLSPNPGGRVFPPGRLGNGVLPGLPNVGLLNEGGLMGAPNPGGLPNEGCGGLGGGGGNGL